MEMRKICVAAMLAAFFVMSLGTVYAENQLVFSDAVFSRVWKANEDVKFYLDTDSVEYVGSGGKTEGAGNVVKTHLIAKTENSPVVADAVIVVDLEEGLLKCSGISLTGLKNQGETKMVVREVESISHWTFVHDPKDPLLSQYFEAVKDYVKHHPQTLMDRSIDKKRNKINIGSAVGQVIIGVKKIQDQHLDIDKPEETPVVSEPNLSWAGKWKTSQGDLEIVEKSGSAECIFNDKKLIGKIDGRKISGTWSDMKFFSSVSDKGEFRFIMSANGKYLQVQWKDEYTDWATDSTADRI